MKRKFKQKLDKYCRRYPKLFARLLGEYPLKEISNAPRSKLAGDYLIPLDVYMTWEKLGFGKTHHYGLTQFIQQNPEFSFHFYDETQVQEYMLKHWGSHPIYPIFRSAKFGAMRVDIWRYCILYEQGGFYFDINKVLSTPLIQFIKPTTTALISYDPDECFMLPPLAIIDKIAHPHSFLINWGFAFAPKHPLLKKVIDNIVAYYPCVANQNLTQLPQKIIKYTGPRMLTRAWWDYLLNQEKDAHLIEAGLNFNDTAIPNVAGSWVRYADKPPYWHSKDTSLFL